MRYVRSFALLVVVCTAGAAEAQTDPLVRAVFSGGAAVLQDDHEDFVISDSALLVVNDSKLRASGMAGALFRLRDLGSRQLSLNASFQFTQGTPALLDGVFFGGALELNEKLHVTAGFGLRKGKELSPGFRRAADEVIRAQLAAGNPAYRIFQDYDVTSKDEAPLDGLPLNAPGTDKPFFPGGPIVDSYNWSYFIGISVPVKLTELFGG